MSTTTPSPPAESTASRARPVWGTAAGWWREAARSTPVWAVLLALLSWRLHDITQFGGGQDGSWILALNVAAQRGLHFGSEITWQYGPLGFLTVPRAAYPAHAWLSVGYATAVQLALCYSLLWALRRALPLLVAVPVTYVAAVLFGSAHSPDQLSASVVTATFICSVAILERSRSGPHNATAFPLAAGAVAGLESLIRLNAGLTVVLMAALVCGFAFPGARRRSLVLFGSAFAATSLGLWLISGQAIGDIPGYLSRSYELIGGYSQALGTDEPSRSWEYLALAAVLVGLSLAAAQATRKWPATRRLLLALLGALFLFSAFKQGFVRHDKGHAPYFFACALGAGFALASLRAPGWLVGPLVVALIGLSAAVTRPAYATALNPLQGLRTAKSDLHGLRHARDIQAAGRANLRRYEALDPTTLRLLRGRTVHVWPNETAVIWAYPALRWKPLPIFHTNLAYTESLDDVDARALASGSAPQRILRSRADMDTFAEGPASRRALFCHYVSLYAGPRWQTLARIPDRCGRPRLIRVVRATSSRTAVAIPRPAANEIVAVSFSGLPPSLAGALRTFVYKGTSWTLELGVGSHEAQYAPGTQTHLLPVAIPPALDYPDGYRFALPAQALRVNSRHPGPSNGEARTYHPIQMRFYAIPVH